MDFLYFLGRLHVLALHLPIGIIYAAVLLEFLARRPRFSHLANAANYLWAMAAITAIITVIFGLLHALEGGFTGPSFERHRILGVLIALFASGLWLFRIFSLKVYLRLQPFTGTLMLLLVAWAGHYGGNMTHGTTYLVQYAPAPLQRLAGIEVRGKVNSLQEADVFLDLIQPMLELRCGSCHWQDTRKGELSFHTYELTMLGGEEYPAFVPGDLQQSEAYYRVTLPSASEDFMPDEGKTPLTSDQIKIMAWWIEAGALGSGSIGDMDLPADIKALVEAQLGLIK